jgi:hypothetical protein
MSFGVGLITLLHSTVVYSTNVEIFADRLRLSFCTFSMFCIYKNTMTRSPACEDKAWYRMMFQSSAAVGPIYIADHLS